MRRFIIVLVFVLLLAGCGVPTGAAPTAPPTVAPAPAATAASVAADPCAPTDLQSYRAAYGDIFNRWSVALVAAGKAQPESLKTPIEQLQSISGEIATLKPPLCAQQANAETAQAMKQIVEGYQNRMGGKNVSQELTAGIDLLAQARAKVIALPGAPAATPTSQPTLTALPTFTPIPTATPTATPTTTPTPLPRNGVVTSKQAQVFETASSTVPIKTLFRGARVQVFEAAKGRLHIKADNVDGWVSDGAIAIQ